MEITATVATNLPESALYATESSLVATSPSGVVVIDPESEEVRWRSSHAGDSAVGAFDSLWVTDFEGRTVRRFDEETGEIQQTVPVDGEPAGVAASEDALWVAVHRQGKVLRIDPATGSVTDEVAVSPEGPGGPQSMAIDGTDLYVASPFFGTVARIDVTTGEETGRVDVPGMPPCGPLTVGAPYVWVTGCLDDDRVARLDFESGAADVGQRLGVFTGNAHVTESTLWFAGVDAGTNAGALVAIDRESGEERDRLDSPGTLDTGVTAFGRFWVTINDGIVALDPGSLP